MRCVIITKTAITEEKIIIGNNRKSNPKITINGNVIAADMEPTETYLVAKNTIKKTAKAVKAGNGNMANKIPSKVDIPLPPLKS